MWSNFLKFDSFSRNHCVTLISAAAESSAHEFLSCGIPKVLINLFILPFSSTVCRQSLWFMYFVESWSDWAFTLNDVFKTLGLDLHWDSFVSSHLSLIYFIMSVALARSSSLWSKILRKARRNLGVNFLKLSGIFVVSRFCKIILIK